MIQDSSVTAVAEAPKAERHIVRKKLTGDVIAAKMQKTIVVRVERRVPHAVFKKIVRVHKKFYAHDETGVAKVGDRVLIRETRPMSKLKRWELVSVLKD
jgi:small subunit ribosomal protein S17